MNVRRYGLNAMTISPRRIAAHTTDESSATTAPQQHRRQIFGE
jgi:hypothetical protein